MSSSDGQDIPADNGRRPPYIRPAPPTGKVGTGDGYSGQEYDSEGQALWRERDHARSVPKDGEVTGSGVGAGGGETGEDFDLDPQSGGGTMPGETGGAGKR
ncbi:hypothetical protein EAH79_02335 [Sphingomonas koreensis]|nr:hypothetical protein EAH79_02335 [Sphingomonas koreensis]